jgi:BirA family biotin operon repressor/biotin-[acetyl-CoA-carboxylase] ligase
MIGRKIIFKETLESTNNYAAKLLQAGELSHGTVIMSGEQTAGRGQRGAVWAAEPYKNLIFTCFLEYDKLSVANHQSITHFVSLALNDLLSFFGISASIKWPNDIVIGNKKIAGVLIENQLESSLLKSSIIGIGLNVNQIEFGGFNATSLKLEKNEDFSIENVSMKLIETLQERFNQLQFKNLEGLKTDYLNQLWLKNQLSMFEDATGVFEGKILGTDDFGRLIVEKNSEEKLYDLKEIKFLDRNISAI